jgi:hypothetical protein
MCFLELYKVVQIWPGQTVTCLHTNIPGHIWTSLYFFHGAKEANRELLQTETSGAVWTATEIGLT